MTAHTRTSSAADGAASPMPERKTLIVRWGKKIGTSYVDGLKECHPGDPDYEDEYAYAVYALEHYGHPMPYVRTPDERAASRAAAERNGTLNAPR